LGAEAAGTAECVTLIFLAAFLTGIGVFDKIAKHAGAGTMVPITGFANAMVSPAMEFKQEGFVTGTAVKLFTVAGPVLVYGISASVVYGVILWVVGLV
jgi:stage V sporulation protein AC